MNGGVVVCEGLFEAFVPNAVQLAESFADEAIEAGVRALLRATLNNHIAELNLRPRLAVETEFVEMLDVPLDLL